MSAHQHQRLIINLPPDTVPEVGRSLWMLEDARRRTLRMIDGLQGTALDQIDPHATHTIGTLLYHLALIEADWLYTEILEQLLPPEMAALFPYDARDEQQALTSVRDAPLAEYLARLVTVRSALVAAVQPMMLAEFRRPRALPEYDVTPEWVLHHLSQHEAEHRGELAALRAQADHAPSES